MPKKPVEVPATAAAATDAAAAAAAPAAAKRTAAGVQLPAPAAKRPALGGGWSSAVDVPPEPRRPTDDEMQGLPAVGEKAVKYFRELIAFAPHAVQGQLAKDQSQGGLGVKAPLNELQPIRIEDMTEASTLTTFREAWNNKNCMASLGQTGLYEAAANIWWVSVETTWFDADQRSAIGDVESLQWGQFVAARALWSDEVFQSSSENPMLRRFAFHGHLPSAVQGVAALEQNVEKNVAIFANLPLFAGLVQLL